ncbi:MAG: Scr1 family TA system antitoxin-like transcriptional regulator [Pseudonocardiales bacterium]
MTRTLGCRHNPHPYHLEPRQQPVLWRTRRRVRAPLDRPARLRRGAAHPGCAHHQHDPANPAGITAPESHHGVNLPGQGGARRCQQRQKALKSKQDFTVVQTEGALRRHISSPEVMEAQMQHLVAVSERPNLRLGVIPWTTPVHGSILHGFQIFDARAVIIGTEAATAIITDPQDVSHYEQRFTGYQALAAFGDEAREVFTRLADEYHNL